jgi:TRAP-type C4-dicarboxylate transport system permease large subunit
MDTIAALIFLVPIMIPFLLEVELIHYILGFYGSHLVIGVLTPPYGLVLFILNKISGVPLEKIIYAVLPFLFR